MNQKKSHLRSGLASLVLAVLTCLVFAGCIRIDANLTLHDMDTFSGEVTVGFTAKVLEGMAEATGMTKDQFLKDDCDSLEQAINLSADQATVEWWQEGDFEGYKITFNKASINAVHDALPLVTWELEQKDGKLSLKAELDPTPYMEAYFEVLDGFEEELQAATVKFSITFPGKVTKANGDISGNTVTWNAKMGQTTAFNATCNSGTPGWVTQLIWAAIVLLLAGVSTLIARRRAKKSKAKAKAVQPPSDPSTQFPGVPPLSSDSMPPPSSDSMPPLSSDSTPPADS